MLIGWCGQGPVKSSYEGFYTHTKQNTPQLVASAPARAAHGTTTAHQCAHGHDHPPFLSAPFGQCHPSHRTRQALLRKVPCMHACMCTHRLCAVCSRAFLWQRSRLAATPPKRCTASAAYLIAFSIPPAAWAPPPKLASEVAAGQFWQWSCRLSSLLHCRPVHSRRFSCYLAPFRPSPPMRPKSPHSLCRSCRALYPRSLYRSCRPFLPLRLCR